MARYVSLLIISVLILCLGATFYQVLAPFLMPLFLAAMASLLVQPILRYFMQRWPNRRSLAAAATTVTFLAPVMIPLLVGILTGGYQLLTLAGKVRESIPKVQDVTAAIPETTEQARAVLAREKDQATRWTLDMVDDVLGDNVTSIDIQMLALSEAQIVKLNENHDVLKAAREGLVKTEFQRIRGGLVSIAGGVAVRTLGIVGRSVGNVFEATVDRTFSLLQAVLVALLALAVFTMALFYFLADGPELIAAAQALIPVERNHQDELLSKFESSVRAVVLATFLAAIGQGLATALCLKLAGFDYFFVLLAISTFAALVPVAGTPLVWIPAVVWLGIEGNWGAAIFVAAFCLIVVGFLDNVIRTWVLKSDTSLHPLLAFVSVLGGLQVMGLWGVFIGPIVACCLHSLIEIFNTELKSATDLDAISQTTTMTDASGNQLVARPVGSEETDKSTTEQNANDASAESVHPKSPETASKATDVNPSASSGETGSPA
ncbi:MAG: AI-2E family transporter [Rhodopirellula sp.]|nr:AI-2E family transporter [Rhodopirellula sp.]